MEEERIVSGFCRQADGVRRVLFEYGPSDGGWKITAADCGYDGCPFAGECPVAAQGRAGEQQETCNHHPQGVY